MLADAIRSAGTAKVVGVFVDAKVEEIAEVHARVDLDIVQLHGAETKEDCAAITRAMNRPVWKAIPVREQRDVEWLEQWPVDAILFDAPTPGRGGSGETFDWSIAALGRRRYPALQIILAGGLTPENVARAISDVSPFAVDVASGVESAAGIKDAAKLTAFVDAVRGR
jgi:phosphoribosylanthranilate isomerase